MVFVCIVGCSVHDIDSDIRVADYAWQWVGRNIDDYPNEILVKKLDGTYYRYIDTYDVTGDWVINGVQYDDHYRIYFYVDSEGWIYSVRVERATLAVIDSDW